MAQSRVPPLSDISCDDCGLLRILLRNVTLNFELQPAVSPERHGKAGITKEPKTQGQSQGVDGDCGMRMGLLT
jgi:hypothetical protein